MYIRRFNRYLNEVAAVVEPGATTTVDAAAATTTTEPAATTALGAAATAVATTTATTETPFGWIPDKFHVKNEDGTLNHEASARKVEEHRGNLERRLGSGDIRPAASTDYKVNVPEALAEKIPADKLAADPDFQAMLAELHASGASQKTVDVAVKTVLERGVAMHEQNDVLDQAECTAELMKVDGWKTETEYTSNMSKAMQAAKAYAGADADALIATYGNDPVICKLLAAVGKELQEDRQAGAESGQLQATLDELMQNPAYLNANDPKHADIKAKVDAMHLRVTGTKNVVGGKTFSFKT